MAAPSPARFFRFGAFQLDLRARELRKNGIKVRVPDQSIQVLAMLLEHPGEVVTREELHQQLWPNGTIVEFEHSIYAAIKRLRLALDDSGDAPRYVETLPRLGYRFIGPIEQAPAREEAVPVEPEASEPEAGPGELEGEVVSHYRILEKLGSGGMGVVYKAEDTRLGRTVALKFLPDLFSDDPAALERFQREARAASALNHPNICTLYDIGRADDRPFLAMEYLEGQTLGQRMAAKPLGLDEIFSLSIQIADALDSAHRHGVVHRDLKPGNIMLTKSGAKLLDFGLAKMRPLETAVGMTALPPTQTTPLTSEGAILGTLQYMAPEQLEGREADARTDIFALGAVIYEMVTGQRAFRGESTISMITAVTRDEPKPLREIVKNVPSDLERIILRCLRKSRDERYTSVSEIERELEDCRALTSVSTGGISLGVLLRKSRRPSVAIPVLLIFLLLGSLSLWWVQRSVKVHWARTQALPEIERLIGQEKRGDAYALAVRAEKYISDDPMLAKFWPEVSWVASIRTTPPGAAVFRRNFGDRDSAWELVGRSPIEKHRLPLVSLQWRFELEGFTVVERATVVAYGAYVMDPTSLSVTMDREAKTPPGMVHQTDGVIASFEVGSLQNTAVALWGLAGFEDLPATLLGDYWLDQYEVTNKQFKQFLDDGGYQKPEYWKHEFRRDGRKLAWADAMALFRDATGRPGPAIWAQGEYPRGQEDFPVSGVSWYEAAAYAAFTGKTLPTIYHWVTAASPWASASIVPASNFGGQGPAHVGQGMSWSGAYDMGGNVKEWCWNEAGSGRRYILGGGWDEPVYMFNNFDARSPFERSANFGFRCAKYTSTGATAKAADPVILPRDFDREKPVSDEVFRVYKSLYNYDKTPLHPIVESVDETNDWKRQKITFAAAYGNERVTAYLFLPKKSQPPFQTVVFFPGAEAIYTRSSAALLEVAFLDFVIKSGRAVLFPVYKGTFERGDDLKSLLPNTTNSWRDHVMAWSKDMGRSIDYVETRAEIDRTKLAYEGTSWGGTMGSMLPAVEERIKVCVLISSGFNLQKSLPEVDEVNFAPRVKVPVLMLNGRYDFVFPVESSQLPMFRLLGTPKEHKRKILYDTGHEIPRNSMIKETLDWLDRYLGPVK